MDGWPATPALHCTFDVNTSIRRRRLLNSIWTDNYGSSVVERTAQRCRLIGCSIEVHGAYERPRH